MPTPASDDAFAEVKAKVDLVKVVQEYVRLTKRNKDFWGLCPFHQEDSPSFHVNPQRQSWYCFGCERKGDVFTFVELIEKTDKRGALQLLAERAGVELKKLSPEQKERTDLRRRLLTMLKLAAQYYEYVLWSNPAGEPGRHLLESRRVGEETAKRFQLGYAPAGRGFAEYLRAKKRSLADAQEAGLMRRDGTDFFAERLVIPIRDERGRRDRLIDAEHGKKKDRTRGGGAGRREGEIDERREHDVAAAEPVPHPSGDRLKRGHRDEVRSDDPARLRDVHLEVARDLRQGDHDHRRVQRHQQIAERDRDRDPPSVPFNLATRGRGP